MSINIIKKIFCGLLIIAMISAPCYLFGQNILYLGKISQLMDVDGVVLHYAYDSTRHDSGKFLQALLGGKHHVHDIYVPVVLPTEQLALGRLLITGHDVCVMGKLCARVFGNHNITLYSYAYNARTNPYGALSRQLVFQFNVNSQRYHIISQTIYQYDLDQKLMVTETVHWLASHGQTHIFNSRNQYDALGHLVLNSQGDNQQHTRWLYRYDGNGNLLERMGGINVLKVSISGIGQAIFIGGQVIHYDADGNQITAINHQGTFGFNARNQLVASLQDGAHFLYGYTANQIRWYKKRKDIHVALHYFSHGAQLLNTVGVRSGQVQAVSHHLLLGSQHVSRWVTNKVTHQDSARYYL